MERVALCPLFVVFVTAGIPTSLPAYPTSLNLIPTADILEANNLRLAYESDGKGQPFGQPNFQYAYSEYGIGDKFEFGVDIYDITNAKDAYYNAKYLLLPESRHLPALAAGVWLVSDVTRPAYYLTGHKSLNQLRIHAGVQEQSGGGWLQFGVDYALSPKLSLLADYQTGSERYHTLGLFCTPVSQISINVYYAHNNTPALRGTDYLAAYVGYTLPLK